MDHIQRGILELIRSAITGQKHTLPREFSLADAETLICEHQIVGIAYEGAVLCGLPKDDPVMVRLFQRYYRLMAYSLAQTKQLEKVFAAFEQQQIDYLPFKGCVLKSLYPKPAMRIMGDADVLIRMEQYDQIRPILEKMGFTEKPQFHHELPWDSSALHLELHRSLMPDYHTQEYLFFRDIWDQAVCVGGHRYTMPAEDAFVYLFVHYAKHYRAGGIGIRQPLDLWIWKRNCPQMDWDAVRQKLDTLQLLTFFENTQNMLKVWFEDQSVTEKTAFMTDYIFSSGSWGKSETHNISDSLLKARQAGSYQKGSALRIVELVFPPLNAMQYRYPFLNKTPWLLPVMWVVRWFSTILFHRDSFRHRSKAFQNASAEKVESFEQALAYVGLDFHL